METRNTRTVKIENDGDLSGHRFSPSSYSLHCIEYMANMLREKKHLV